MESDDLARIEDEFKAAVKDLRNDPGLDRLQVEYIALFNALKASQTRAATQRRKFIELSEALQVESVGVESVLKLSQSDEAVRRRLLRQIDTVRGAIEKLKERETKNEQKLTFLNQSIATLEENIRKAEMLSSHSGILQEKADELEALTAEVAGLTQKEEAMRAATQLQRKEHEKLMTERQSVTFNEQQLRDQTAKLSAAVELQEESKVVLSAAQDELRQEASNIATEKELFLAGKRETREEIRVASLAVVERLKQGRHTDKQIEQLGRVLTSYAKKIARFQETVDQIRGQTAAAEEKTHRLESSRVSLGEEMDAIATEVARDHGRIASLEASCKETNALSERSRKAVLLLEGRLEASVALQEEDAKKILRLAREVNLLREIANRAEHSRRELSQDVEDALKRRIRLQNEKQMQLHQLQALQRSLETEKNLGRRVAREKEALTKKAEEEHAKLREKMTTIDAAQAKVNETAALFAKQKALLEAVKSDRLHYSKQLLDVRNEMGDLRRRYKALLSSISHLREEIDRQDISLEREAVRIREGERACSLLLKGNEQLSKLLTQKQLKRVEIGSAVEELKDYITEFGSQHEKLCRELDLVVGERNMLSAQLAQKREAVLLLEEKARIIASLIRRTQARYRQRQQHVATLKSECQTVIVQIKCLLSDVTKLPQFYVDIQFLQKEVLREKLKRNFLLTELQTPLNIHRWRRLEATDARAIELIRKCQGLQKRLLQKNEELRKKKQEAASSEAEITRLKDTLARQPTIVDASQCESVREELRLKQVALEKIEVDLLVMRERCAKSAHEKDEIEKEIVSIKHRLVVAIQENSQNGVNQLKSGLRLPPIKFRNNSFRLRYSSKRI